MTNFLFFILFAAGFLLLSSLFRFLFGKKAQLRKAFTSAMEILCLYLIYIYAYSLELDWEIFSSPLPFLSVTENALTLLPMTSASFLNICDHLARLLLLAFPVNLINAIIPKGKKLWLWLPLRAGTVVLTLYMNYGLDLLLRAVLPQGIAAVAPLILLAVLILLILVGSLKLIVGAALCVANPVVGGLYTFFFSNLIGRALARAVLTTGLITALVYWMDRLGIGIFALSAVSLSALLPALLLLILLWYAVDRIL